MEAMRQSWSDDRLDDLQMEMRAGFARMESQIQQGTEQVEKRIEQMGMQIELMDKRIEQMDKRIDRVEDRVEGGFARVEVSLGRLDGRIDFQARAIVYLATVLFTTMAALYASRIFG